MTDLKTTPLHGLHAALGAKMVPFAGYDMPVQYPLGVMKEHLFCRADAGLFDVSHMGQLRITGPDPAAAFEALVPQAVSGLAVGRQRYGFLTNETGGIIDDLMMARVSDGQLAVVINAANRDAVLAHIRAGLPGCDVAEVPNALLALQGPKAEAALAQVIGALPAMRFMDYAETDSPFGPLALTRSGYTGEDGFEISVAPDQAEALARALLALDTVEAIGLGARDSLRLEAGLCLYGNDIDTGTSPVEAGLVWAIQTARRTGGARQGGFPGAARILHEIETAPKRLRVGLRPEGRAPMRAGVALYATPEGGAKIGSVTSGGFGPTVAAPVAMGYVQTDHAAEGTALWGEVRGKRLPVTVAALPFAPANFKR